jgi:hypothetical protein
MAGSGRRVFAPGEVLTASNTMNYLMDQTVMNFAGTAARGSAIGTAVSEGMVSYLADTNSIEVYTGSGWNQVSQVNSDNILINGAMEIAQRGTSIPLTSTTAYTLDRWKAVISGAFTIAQVASGISDIRYALRFQRNSGQTSTVTQDLVQGVETANAINLAGKSVTLSFYARAGANYSPAGSALGVALYSGTGTDENPASAYTGQATIISSSATLTTSWQRFSFTGSVGSTATELKPIFSMTGVGTAGAADYYELTGVQLEVGQTPTPFRRNANSIQGELAECQRYYISVPDETLVIQSTVQFQATLFPTTMRAAPTVTIIGTSGAGSVSVSVTTTHGFFTSNSGMTAAVGFTAAIEL